jgi:hypothetical protein
MVTERRHTCENRGIKKLQFALDSFLSGEKDPANHSENGGTMT